LSIPLPDAETCLTKNQGLVVHFSTCPKMSRRPDLLYPCDLRFVIHGGLGSTKELCCCVVRPGEKYSADNSGLPGCIGLLVDYRKGTLRIGGREDGGTIEDDDGNKEVDPRVPQTVEMFIECVEKPDASEYNEFLVGNPKVLGIFVDPLFAVGSRKELSGDLYTDVAYKEFKDYCKTLVSFPFLDSAARNF
jgi:hypothetical protein